MAQKKGKRFPLLIYARFGKKWSRMGLLLAVLAAVLWLLTPRLSIPAAMRPLAALPVIAGLLLMLYGVLASRMSYVQCGPRSIRIQTPFYPVVLSYRRVKLVRPVQMNKIFDSQKEKPARRAWPPAYWAMTGLIVEVGKFPVDERWLRLWLDRYLFWQEGTGFVLLVEDWMGLSQQLDSFRSAYRAQAASR